MGFQLKSFLQSRADFEKVLRGLEKVDRLLDKKKNLRVLTIEDMSVGQKICAVTMRIISVSTKQAFLLKHTGTRQRFLDFLSCTHDDWHSKEFGAREGYRILRPGGPPAYQRCGKAVCR